MKTLEGAEQASEDLYHCDETEDIQTSPEEDK